MRHLHKFMKFFFRVFPNLERVPLELRDDCSVKLVAYFIGPKSCRKYFEDWVDFAKLPTTCVRFLDGVS